jgi:hypothetical protein
LIEALGTRKQYFDDLSIYPNPAKDRLTVSFGNVKSDLVKVNLLDIQGRTVQEASVRRGENETLEIHVGHLQDGMYILNVVDAKSGQSLSSYKVVIKR